MDTSKLIGEKVKSARLGVGVISSFVDGRILVEFPSREAKFSFPSAFAGGYLSIEGDSDLQSEIIEYAQIEKALVEETKRVEKQERKTEDEKTGTSHWDDVQLGIAFSTHDEAINACFGLGYKRYQRAYLCLEDKGIAIWFPSIARRIMGEYIPAETGRGWMNILSDNGKTIYEKNVVDDEQNRVERNDYDRLVFAKFGEENRYEFIGVFRPSGFSEETGFKYIRIGTKYDLNEMKVVE